nr:uncharacterized protein LOC129267982 [Lytechinus pictus]
MIDLVAMKKMRVKRKTPRSNRPGATVNDAPNRSTPLVEVDGSGIRLEQDENLQKAHSSTDGPRPLLDDSRRVSPPSSDTKETAKLAETYAAIELLGASIGVFHASTKVHSNVPHKGVKSRERSKSPAGGRKDQIPAKSKMSLPGSGLVRGEHKRSSREIKTMKSYPASSAPDVWEKTNTQPDSFAYDREEAYDSDDEADIGTTRRIKTLEKRSQVKDMPKDVTASPKKSGSPVVRKKITKVTPREVPGEDESDMGPTRLRGKYAPSSYLDKPLDEYGSKQRGTTKTAGDPKKATFKAQSRPKGDDERDIGPARLREAPGEDEPDMGPTRLRARYAPSSTKTAEDQKRATAKAQSRPKGNDEPDIGPTRYRTTYTDLDDSLDSMDVSQNAISESSVKTAATKAKLNPSMGKTKGNKKAMAGDYIGVRANEGGASSFKKDSLWKDNVGGLIKNVYGSLMKRNEKNSVKTGQGKEVRNKDGSHQGKTETAKGFTDSYSPSSNLPTLFRQLSTVAHYGDYNDDAGNYEGGDNIPSYEPAPPEPESGISGDDVSFVGLSAPPEILARGPRARRAYAEAAQAGTKKVFRTRLMLVGQERVGKTSLKKTLTGQGFDKNEVITDGVETTNACEINIQIAKAGGKLWSIHKKGHENEDAKEGEYSKALADEIAKRLIVTPPQDQESLGPQIDATDGRGLNPQEAAAFISDDVEAPTAGMEDVSTNMPNQIASLVEKMLKEQLRMQEVGTDSTDGGKDDGVSLSIWDFAGHDIYYTTHQVFLTWRAIYVVVFDLSRSLDSVVPPESRDDYYEMAISTGQYYMNTTGHFYRTVPQDSTTGIPQAITTGQYHRTVLQDSTTRQNPKTVSYDSNTGIPQAVTTGQYCRTVPQGRTPRQYHMTVLQESYSQYHRTGVQETTGQFDKNEAITDGVETTNACEINIQVAKAGGKLWSIHKKGHENEDAKEGEYSKALADEIAKRLIVTPPQDQESLGPQIDATDGRGLNPQEAAAFISDDVEAPTAGMEDVSTNMPNQIASLVEKMLKEQLRMKEVGTDSTDGGKDDGVSLSGREISG